MRDVYKDLILSELKMTTGYTNPGITAYAASASASRLVGVLIY